MKVAWLGCFLFLLSGVIETFWADQGNARQALVSRVKQAKTLRVLYDARVSRPSPKVKAAAVLAKSAELARRLF